MSRDPTLRRRILTNGNISNNLIIKKLVRLTGCDAWPLGRVRRPELISRLIEAEIEAGYLDAEEVVV